MNFHSTPVVPFENVLEDVSGGNRKVQKGDYQPNGRYPIVDQGQDFIGGYSNDQQAVVRGKGPWIVFGDHTRSLKYVDFPFCMGADGVKVLKPRTDRAVDTKFLYHFLCANPLPSAGYSRHYKFLKRLEIPLPPLDEQRQIAAILDKADALRRKRRRVLELFDSLSQSIFLEMFGDPKKETVRWPLLSFGEACEDRTSKSYKVQRSTYLVSGRHPVIDQGQEFVAGWVDDNDLVTIVAKPVIVFGDHTRVVKYVDFDFVVGADGVKVLLPTTCFNARYFASLMRLLPIPDLGYSRHMRAVKELGFMCPPLEMQKTYSARIEKTNEWFAAMSRSLQNCEALFASLQYRAFSGQL